MELTIDEMMDQAREEALRIWREIQARNPHWK